MEQLSKSFGMPRESLRKLFKRNKIDFSKIKKDHENSLKHEYLENPNVCQFCGKSLPWESRNNKFCSKTCANSVRKLSSETKSKISKKLSEYYKLNKKLYTCSVCGKQYYYEKGINTKKCCCKDCSIKLKTLKLTAEVRQKLSLAGRKSVNVQKDKRRSKNEIYFYELCENHFSSVEHNSPIFNNWDADVIIHDIKFAVLWNGVWHYKTISKKSIFNSNTK